MIGRWFHANITGQEAEDLLTSKNEDGTFLVRPSQSKPGNFTISVKHKGEVTHIKIHYDGDCFQLVSLDGTTSEPFASLGDLVQHCMESDKAIPLKDGGYIELTVPIISEDPTTERWFHGPLKGKEAEKILLSKGKVGHFLVRESQSQPGQYVLTVRCEHGVAHVIVNNRGRLFDVGSGNQFPSLVKLVDFYKKNPQLRDLQNHSVIKLEEPFHSTSFLASNIEERIKQLQKEIKPGVTGFREEFEQVQYHDQKQGTYSTKNGQKIENKAKNRYKNILPYDHSRVVLRDGDQKVPGSDYINANRIDSELRECETTYIAAQGCLPVTIPDFYRMIFQENCLIVVMLTNEVEKGKAKCARYWPNVGMTQEYGNYIIDNMLEHNMQDFVIRELRIYHKEKGQEPPRMVYHFHYTAWPDHGAPEDPNTVLALLEEVHSQHAKCNNVGPLLFHCSAGIGRTGTVIVIDVLMHLIEEQGLNAEIDVQKTTQLLRTKRAGMIQTEFQYRFVYAAIRHFTEVKRTREKSIEVLTEYIIQRRGIFKQAIGVSCGQFSAGEEMVVLYVTLALSQQS